MDKGTCSVDECGAPVFVKLRMLCKKHYSRWYRHGTTDLAPPLCRTCGCEFARRAHDGPLARYCSSECDPTKVPDARDCLYCGTLFERRKTRQRFCSPACRNRAGHSGGSKIPERDCVRCGEPIDFDLIRPGGRKLRNDTRKCTDCSRNWRCVLNIEQLVERDGADCSLCGDPVDLTLVWPHRMAPTRDHVIPWSLGGSNDADNLALAHFLCNIRKRNRVA